MKNELKTKKFMCECGQLYCTEIVDDCLVFIKQDKYTESVDKYLKDTLSNSTYLRLKKIDVELDEKIRNVWIFDLEDHVVNLIENYYTNKRKIEQEVDDYVHDRIDVEEFLHLPKHKIRNERNK